MELTRRDALAALVSAGVVAGSGATALSRDVATEDDRDVGARTERVLDALVATAEVVYPSAVENTRAFVEAYGGTKLDRRPEFGTGAAEALTDLDAESRVTFDARFAALDADERDVALHRVGARTADPDPDGTAAERVRYYFVNEVLYALYASPTGGELVGIENPQGHPGGTDTYQRGPPE
jgi:hypothetical protein